MTMTNRSSAMREKGRSMKTSKQTSRTVLEACVATTTMPAREARFPSRLVKALPGLGLFVLGVLPSGCLMDSGEGQNLGQAQQSLVRPEDIVELPYESRFILGRGINPKNGHSYNSPFVYEGGREPTTEHIIAETQFRADAFSTESARQAFIDASLAADVQAWGQEFSASAQYLNELEISSTMATFAIHKWRYGQEKRFDVGADVALSAAAAALLRESPAEFVERYGPYMIASHKLGCVFDGVVTIETSSRSEAQAIAGSLRGEWRAFGASGSVEASLETKLEESNASQRVTAQYHSKGYLEEGEGAAWSDPTDIAGMFALANRECPSSSAFAVTTTSWTEVRVVSDVLHDAGQFEEFITQQDLALAGLSRSEQLHKAARAEQLRQELLDHGLYVGLWAQGRLEALEGEISAYIAELDSAADAEVPAPRVQEFVDELEAIAAGEVQVTLCATLSGGGELCQTVALAGERSWTSAPLAAHDGALRVGATYKDATLRAFLTLNRLDGTSVTRLSEPLGARSFGTSTASLGNHAVDMTHRLPEQESFYSPELASEAEVGAPIFDYCAGRHAILKVADANLTMHAYGGSRELTPIKLHGNMTYARQHGNSKFQLVPDGGHFILKVSDANLAMHAHGGSWDTAPIKLHGNMDYARQHDNSKFEIIEHDGMYIFKVADANLTMHAHGGSGDGTPIKLHGDVSYARQHDNSRFAIECVD